MLLKREIDKEKRERPEGVIVQEGACRFCGQIKKVDTIWGWLEEKVDEYATQTCNCDDAKQYHRKIEQEDAVRAKIDEIFGKEESGVMMQTKTTEILHTATSQIISGELDSIVIVSGDQVKAKITMTSKGYIKIVGSAGISVSAEV